MGFIAPSLSMQLLIGRRGREWGAKKGMGGGGKAWGLG